MRGLAVEPLAAAHAGPRPALQAAHVARRERPGKGSLDLAPRHPFAMADELAAILALPVPPLMLGKVRHLGHQRSGQRLLGLVAERAMELRRMAGKAERRRQARRTDAADSDHALARIGHHAIGLALGGWA